MSMVGLSKPRLTVRHATSRDLRSVLEFYEANRASFNYPRADDVIHGAINDDRKLFIVESDNGATIEIVAAAAVFSHLDGRFREVGATRVVANGFRLQVLLKVVSIIHEHLIDPSYEEIYCTILPDNTASIHNMEKSGFEPWSIPDPDLREEKKRLSAAAGRNANVSYFRLPHEAIYKLAADLLNYESSGRLHRRDGEYAVLNGVQEVELTLVVESLLYYRPAVVELANEYKRSKPVN